MKRSLILIMVFVVSFWSMGTRTESCELKTIETGVRAWLDGIKDYRADALISVGGAKAKSQITGKRPDRLRLQLEITNSSGSSTQIAVFDGTHQWVESKKASGTQVLKIRCDELTKADRPFDTAYYVMGTGVLNGEDLPSTIERLLFLYALTPKCSDDKIVLSGKIDRDKLKEYASVRNPLGLSKGFTDAFAKNFGVLSLEIDASDYHLLGYSIGAGEGGNNFNARFESIQTNTGLTNKDFSYTPPDGIKPQDITDLLKEKGKKKQ